MGGPCVNFLRFVIQFQLILLALAQKQTLRTNSGNLAIFAFGDSFVDPGNNNYIRTISKANFPPYGIDFENQIPTGRFTNGRLVTDYAASYAGIKDYVPPYLDRNLSMEELLTGVSFASAGSGYDPLTPTLTGGVISMPKQIDHFREYKSRIETQIGKERTEALIKNAVYVISAGSNDFLFNYFWVSGIRRLSYSLPRYYHLLMQQLQHFLQDLLDLGAGNIVMMGLPPLGCFPLVITLKSNPINGFLERQCVTRISDAAQGFNQIAKQKCFDKADTSCCGTGILEVSIFCNRRSRLCPNVSDHVFFDSLHPTERTYSLLFEALAPTIDLILQGKQ
ncbi:GDSL esterase/lipase At5g45960 isoform X2 [Daucus carota subsp. sativus]|uniref:GDSL esterase/lipase At5g45960 isoform X2 n=1 Tax=Daucus carota subsp. sativus TaxID=79200 RepID=UPI0007EF37FC|nr:PREDICTED: GDSL esterase/lipase At5g45960 isoform X2 [Daucus carota subsp. sativus]